MSLPNLRFPTLGGHFFWDTLDSRKGFKLQKNSITGHYRVLDPADYRIDWDLNEGPAREAFYQLTSGGD